MTMTMTLPMDMLLFCLTMAAVVALIMAKRLNTAVKKLKVVNKEITWLIYLAVGIPLLLAAQLIPMSVLLFMILWVAIALPISFHFNKKYDIWLDAKRKDRKRQENLERLMEIQMRERER